MQLCKSSQFLLISQPKNGTFFLFHWDFPPLSLLLALFEIEGSLKEEGGKEERKKASPFLMRREIEWRKERKGKEVLGRDIVATKSWNTDPDKMVGKPVF